MQIELAIFVACVTEYFNDAETGENNQKSKEDEDPIYKGFKAVLDSKSQDETMVSYFFSLVHFYIEKKKKKKGYVEGYCIIFQN